MFDFGISLPPKKNTQWRETVQHFAGHIRWTTESVGLPSQTDRRL